MIVYEAIVNFEAKAKVHFACKIRAKNMRRVLMENRIQDQIIVSLEITFWYHSSGKLTIANI